MRKILNKPETFVDDTMEGIRAAYGDKVKFMNGDPRVLLSDYPTPDKKVGIVTAGGSGHLPTFLGYVGSGMLDGCAIGNVFASPSYTKMADMIRACDRGAGVLCLYGNYGGDVMNFKQAIEDVDFDDITAKMVIVCDDVASAPAAQKEKRRGVAGLLYAFKIAGAAAWELRSLDEVIDVTRRALDNICTMGVALSPCIVPEVGSPTFQVEDGYLELGMGIHGEKGISVEPMMTADALTDRIMAELLKNVTLNQGDEVSVMVNGLGATPLEEQLIVFKRVSEILKERGVSIFMPHVGEFATSMEMAGLSITVFKLDDEFKRLLRAPAETPFYTNSNK